MNALEKKFRVLGMKVEAERICVREIFGRDLELDTKIKDMADAYFDVANYISLKKEKT